MLVGPYPYDTSKTYIGSLAQENRLNIISSNLANIDTPGFKKDVPQFDGYLVKSSKISFQQGNLKPTGNKLDLALSGPGFFQVETPNGVRYTRSGAFTRNSQGEIVTSEGYLVVGGGVIPEDTVDLAIAPDGRIMADQQEIGRFEIVEFENNNVLTKEGRNLYNLKVPGGAGTPSENTSISQGYIEGSNVDPVMEQVNLIDTVRTYEVFQKVIQSLQEADQKSINEVGRIS